MISGSLTLVCSSAHGAALSVAVVTQ